MSLQGFTMAMFRLDTLVEQSLRGMAWGRWVSSSLMSQMPRANICSHSNSTRHAWHPSPLCRARVRRQRPFGRGCTLGDDFPIAGRTWSVLFHPMLEARHTYARQEWGYSRRRAAVHAALCWVLHPEGEIVSPGIDIAGYRAGG